MVGPGEKGGRDETGLFHFVAWTEPASGYVPGINSSKLRRQASKQHYAIRMWQLISYTPTDINDVSTT